jgi:hypothetical protein
LRLFTATSHDRREDRDALLAFANEAADTPPGVKPRHASRTRPLRDNETDVVQTVAMEAAHRLQQRDEPFAATLLEQGRELVQ